MPTVVALLDRLKAANSITSDYALAQLLQVSPQNVALWRNGVSAPDSAILVRIAELLGQEPMPVVALVELEREQRKKKPRAWAIELWSRYSPRLLPAIVAALLVAGSGIIKRSAAWFGQGPALDTIYIMRTFRRLWLRRWSGKARTALGVVRSAYAEPGCSA